MKIRFFFLFTLLILLTNSCSEENHNPEDAPINRVVLVYMAADNDLSNYSDKNIRAIMNNALGKLDNGKLFIYCDRLNTEPELIEVVEKNGQIQKRVVKEYDEHNSASGEVLSRVINDTFSVYESKSRGLILWSHATAWLPAEKNLWTRSFGRDGLDEMHITELKENLPDSYFDFIVFDACLMSSVEVCFELKDKAKYIVGSPNEIFANGFPYERVIQDLFTITSLEEMLESLCDSFFDYYSTHEMDVASISLINTSKLNELAELCSKILEDKANILDMDIDNVQPIYYSSARNKILYDFRDFIIQLSEANEIQQLDSLLKEIILYTRWTEKIYVTNVGLIKLERNCGLSTYIPRQKTLELNKWYLNLDWAKAAYGQEYKTN